MKAAWVTWVKEKQRYPDSSKRFVYRYQVLWRETVRQTVLPGG